MHQRVHVDAVQGATWVHHKGAPGSIRGVRLGRVGTQALACTGAEESRPASDRAGSSPWEAGRLPGMLGALPRITGRVQDVIGYLASSCPAFVRTCMHRFPRPCVE